MTSNHQGKFNNKAKLAYKALAYTVTLTLHVDAAIEARPQCKVKLGPAWAQLSPEARIAAINRSLADIKALMLGLPGRTA